MADTPRQLKIGIETLRRAGLFPEEGTGLVVERPEEGGQPDFRAVLEVLPVAIYMTDADGRITFYNDAAAELWGHRPEVGRTEWCGSWKLFWPDGQPMPHGECPMAVALKERRPVYGLEAIAERPDGRRVHFLPFPTPLFDKNGDLVGGVNLLIDITDRKRAEDYERRYAAIVEFSEDAILSKDLNGVIATWNPGAQRLFGYTAAEVVGKPVTILMPPERVNEEPEILERIRRGERIEHYETVRRRKDGSLINISLTVSPVRNSEGRIVGASKIARDITDRKRAEEKQALLFGEMRHRIKNSLAIAQVLATQTLRSASAAEQAAFNARLASLSAAQDVLTASTWDRVPLREVVLSGLATFTETYGPRIRIDGTDEVSLEADKVLSLTLVLHELATNAVKYGALSADGGMVRIGWSLIGASGARRRIRFEWKESGGPPVAEPEVTGFGSRLINRSFGERAAMDFRPDGLFYSLEADVV